MILYMIEEQTIEQPIQQPFKRNRGRPRKEKFVEPVVKQYLGVDQALKQPQPTKIQQTNVDQDEIKQMSQTEKHS